MTHGAEEIDLLVLALQTQGPDEIPKTHVFFVFFLKKNKNRHGGAYLEPQHRGEWGERQLETNKSLGNTGQPAYLMSSRHLRNDT